MTIVRFELVLGNEEMQDVEDVAGALECTARRLREETSDLEDLHGQAFLIKDINGNTVGEFTVAEERG